MLLNSFPLNWKKGENSEEFAARAKEECERVGIEMGSYTVGADFINGSEGDLNM